MTKFYNPYQFVPVTGEVNGKPVKTINYTDIHTGSQQGQWQLPGSRHDLWQAGRFSGRIICQLSNHTPLVIGARQHKASGNAPATVLPYISPVHSQPAIPANSLKGVISSVAETLSQSTLRVLKDSPLSIRKPRSGSLSAVGLIRKKADGSFMLQPMSLPNMPQKAVDAKLPKWLAKLPAEHPVNWYLTAYVGNYGGRNGDRYYQNNTFLEQHQPDSFSLDKPQYYYAELHHGFPNTSDHAAITTLKGKHAALHSKRETLLGQRIKQILTADEWQNLAPEQQQKYTRGVLFVLGIDGQKRAHLPSGKKHELFIPYPEEKAQKYCEIPISDDALRHFKALAELRNRDEAYLPFTPKGYQHPRAKETLDFTPLDGCLMYFDLDRTGSEVTELSYSSIWREHKQTLFDYLQEDTLKPWGTTKRDGLTPAEALFGVVEEKKQQGHKQTRNLAGRVRFSEANSVEQITLLPKTTLKKLNSPKLPCPSMYFHHQHADQRVITKHELTPHQHQINGRKFYLHQKPVKPEQWRSTAKPGDRGVDMQVEVEPIPANSCFYFHIDVENISQAELGLLLTALQPSDSFMHKLGMGKPLGLGSVVIQPLALFQIDRQQRYRLSGLTAARYQTCWAKSECAEHWLALAERGYQTEVELLASKVSSWQSWPQTLVDTSSLKSMLKLGETAHLEPGIPISYPFTASQQAYSEAKLFQWFTENEALGTRGQSLPSLNSAEKLQPLLDRVTHGSVQHHEPPHRREPTHATHRQIDRPNQKDSCNLLRIQYVPAHKVKTDADARRYATAIIEALADEGEKGLKIKEIEKHQYYLIQLECQNSQQAKRLLMNYENQQLSVPGWHARTRLLTVTGR